MRRCGKNSNLTSKPLLCSDRAAVQPIHTDHVNSPTPQISVGVPIYNEAERLPAIVDRVGQGMRASGRTFELIAVDDGSSDGSAALLQALARDRPWLRPVCLARNCGQSCALQAGGGYQYQLEEDAEPA